MVKLLGWATGEKPREEDCCPAQASGKGPKPQRVDAPARRNAVVQQGSGAGSPAAGPHRRGQLPVLRLGAAARRRRHDRTDGRQAESRHLRRNGRLVPVEAAGVLRRRHKPDVRSSYFCSGRTRVLTEQGLLAGRVPASSRLVRRVKTVLCIEGAVPGKRRAAHRRSSRGQFRLYFGG